MNFSLKRTRVIAALAYILIGILAGIACLAVPEPKDLRDPKAFSAVNASNWIKTLSERPHSVFDIEAHQRVLEYLSSELEKLGLDVSLMQFTLRNTEPENGGPEKILISNIHGRLRGKSEKAILLMAHYDSVYDWDFERDIPKGGVSFGAADDGYGVAVILEMLRAIQASGKPLENTIEILLTDGEEVGLLGSERALSHHAGVFKNVKLVINIEARGVKGPAVLFETGKNNAAAMRFYLQHARMPISYSAATEVYRLSPIETDLTPFIQKGFDALNFAVLYSMDYYHTAADNFDNISLPSLQHYGEQLLPMVKAFAFTPSDKVPSLRSDRDDIFFNLLPGTLICYSKPVAFILLVITAVLYLLSVLWLKRRGCISLKRMLLISGGFVGAILIFGIMGTVVAFILSMFANKIYHIAYLVDVPFSDLWQLALVASAWITVMLRMHGSKHKNRGRLDYILAGTMVNLMLSFLTTLFVTGASFLFTIPALLAALYVISVCVFRNPLFKDFTAVPAIILTLAVFVPVTYLAYLALTLGAAGIVTMLSLFAFIMVVPVAWHYAAEG